MIGSLRGRLLDRLGEDWLVEVGGLGYKVTVGGSVPASVGRGDEVLLYVHHHLREDTEALYGFGSLAELRCFEAMLKANRVGPALALSIMAVHDPGALAQLLRAGDVDSLCLVPGIGAKTAARLLVELQAHLGVDEEAPAAVSTAPTSGGALADVRMALLELGYRDEQIATTLAALPESEDASELLKLALSNVAIRA